MGHALGWRLYVHYLIDSLRQPHFSHCSGGKTETWSIWMTCSRSHHRVSSRWLQAYDRLHHVGSPPACPCPPVCLHLRSALRSAGLWEMRGMIPTGGMRTGGAEALVLPPELFLGSQEAHVVGGAVSSPASRSFSPPPKWAWLTPHLQRFRPICCRL